MCNFLKNPIITQAIENGVPVTTPRLPGALGFDVPLWVGFGMVGIWAALDALAERAGLPGANCELCQGRTCIRARFDDRLQDNEERSSFAEIEDIRHLYAHNFAGHADEQYFSRPRHVLARGTQTELASGAEFNGERSVKIALVGGSLDQGSGDRPKRKRPIIRQPRHSDTRTEKGISVTAITALAADLPQCVSDGSWGDGHESAASRYRLRHGDDFHLSSICYGSTRLSEREMEKRALRVR
jgi:hypothetical protein